MDFITHWMLTISAAAFLALCGFLIGVIRRSHHKRHSSGGVR